MNKIELTVNKVDVYDEVAKTTSYAGAKMVGDEGAYLRIFTTDADQEMLERFWNEAESGAIDQLKPYIGTWSNEDGLKVELVLSSGFDINLKDSIQSSLFSYFVAMIVSKWFKLTNKGEAAAYGVEAVGAMDDVMSKIYHRKRPVREKRTHCCCCEQPSGEALGTGAGTVAIINDEI